jgi:hypothetical protein
MKKFTQQHEVWGRIEYETFVECSNENCGDEAEEEIDEDEEI